MAGVYGLYLESGPQRKTTMIHVPALLGCVAVGRTTEAALAGVDEAIDQYRHFVHRCGEPIDLAEPIRTRVVEHITEGDWLGRGSPYIVFEFDLEPVEEIEVGICLNRFRTMRSELIAWAESLDPAALDAEPADGGWPARKVLTHLVGPSGGYLSAALGSAPGFSALKGKVDRGEIDVLEALRREVDLVADRLGRVTAEDRYNVVERATTIRTLRKALRRMLEHEWEHRVQLARRPDGPSVAGDFRWV